MIEGMPRNGYQSRLHNRETFEQMADSRKVDAPPLLNSGVKIIGHWQLDDYFYKPFITWNEEATRRKFLVNRLSAYLAELRKFELLMEIWLDGSFTTTKVEPEDVDLVVFVHMSDLLSLSLNRQKYFERLTMDREIMRATYEVDVYLASLDSPDDIETHTTTFSRGHYQENEKGFYKIVQSKNV